LSDTRSVSSARYLLQIVSMGEWKAVAYLNDIEEAMRTAEKVPAVRVFDTWRKSEVQLQQVSRGFRAVLKAG